MILLVQKAVKWGLCILIGSILTSVLHSRGHARKMVVWTVFLAMTHVLPFWKSQKRPRYCFDLLIAVVLEYKTRQVPRNLWISTGSSRR